MNKQEQLDFVDQLINTVHKQIMEQVNARAPDNWDGIELRQFVSDAFGECVIKGMMTRKRRIAYNNQLYSMPR